jgi:hypothetical protein
MDVFMNSHPNLLNQLALGVAVCTLPPEGWRALPATPIVIIVGVTGVGKSTTLAGLAQTPLAYTLLPNRRDLTDRLIIAQMQAEAGDPIEPVSDRSQRFAYTRGYRERFPGGMSHALTQLCIDPSQMQGLLLFDGLRGADEIGHAVQTLPLAHFIVLHAPDVVRVQRLLTRNDRFDQVAVATAAPETSVDLAGLGLAADDELFTPAESQPLLALVQQGEVSAAELRAKLQIVREERRNYDPLAAIDLLHAQAAARTLVIDTTVHDPEAVVTAIVGRVQAWGLDGSRG